MVRRLHIVLVTAVVCLGVTARIVEICHQPMLGYDDVISVLAATGHQQEYVHLIITKNFPYGRWTTASQWKRLLDIENWFCFAKIGRGLSDTDIHPPLYFWILHVWYLIVGVKLHSGPALNVLLDLFSFMLLYRFARFVLTDQIESMAVAAMWFLSFSVLQITITTRQYALLSMLTLIVLWLIIALADHRFTCKPVHWLLLGVCMSLGFLSHYFFPLVLAGSLLLPLVTLWKRHRRRLGTMLGITAGAALLFWILHPGFLQSLIRHQRWMAQAGQTAHGVWDILRRCKRSASSLGVFYCGPSKFLLGLAIVGLLCLATWIVLRRLLGRGPDSQKIPRVNRMRVWCVLYSTLVTAGVAIVPYIMLLTQEHAMTPRHLGMAFPFLAFIPALIFRCAGRLSRWLCLLLMVFVLCHCAYRTVEGIGAKPQETALIQRLSNSKRLAVDNVRWGIWPRFLWFVDENAQVLAASQLDLIASFSLEEPTMRSGGMYLALKGYESTDEGRRAIIKLLLDRYEVREEPVGYSRATRGARLYRVSFRQ